MSVSLRAAVPSDEVEQPRPAAVVMAEWHRAVSAEIERLSGAPAGTNLSGPSSDYQSLDLAIGLSADQVVALGPSLKLRAELRARYDHEFLDTHPTLDASISGNSFAVEGASAGSDFGLVGTTLEFIDPGGLSTFLGYDFRGNTKLQEHNVSVGLLIHF